MSLSQILVFVIFAALVVLLRRGPGNIPLAKRIALVRWLLLAGSVLAIYWMQPSTPVRHLDFWLPTATLGLVALVWAVTREPVDRIRSEEGVERERGERDERREKTSPGATHLPSALHLACKLMIRQSWEMDENWLASIVVAGIVLLVGLGRYLPGPACCLTPTPPPEIWKILLAIGALGLAILGLAVAFPSRRIVLYLATCLLLGIFIVLKTDPLAQTAAAGLRALTGQSTRLASALDIRWLGFSYIAFRLLHTLRDRLGGRLPALSLAEFITYSIFFPAFTAGPIDRAQRFTQELRRLDPGAVLPGGQRIFWGIFKKFAIADSLALIAINATNAGQVQSGLWLWALLYAYALRIYFDFSGYTDIAIGLGELMGFHLPENFERPYLKANLTAFWNSWHITLAQWFRAYFFNPLTRLMRSGGRKYPLWLVVLTGQLSTMLLIGLWHGITWNFAAWGLWHGIGLFIHSRWTEGTRARMAGLDPKTWLGRALKAAGVLVTFQYVTLGWVWFALPSVELSGKVFLKLLGV